MNFKQHSIVLLFFLSSSFIWAQPAYERGLAYEKEYKSEEALLQYEEVLKTNPNHADAWTHASRMLSNIGGHLPASKKEEKAAYYEKARLYGERAIKLDDKNIHAHLALTIALGLLSEVPSSPSEKVKNAKRIYEEGETMLRLDSTFAVAYFVLGKWHFELARLNWVEKLACELFFGGLPEGISMERAIYYLQKASVLEPNTILYLFGEARAYYALGEKKRAIALLKRAIALPNREPDDVLRKERCRDLLQEIEEG